MFIFYRIFLEIPLYKRIRDFAQYIGGSSDLLFRFDFVSSVMNTLDAPKLSWKNKINIRQDTAVGKENIYWFTSEKHLQRKTWLHWEGWWIARHDISTLVDLPSDEYTRCSELRQKNWFSFSDIKIGKHKIWGIVTKANQTGIEFDIWSWNSFWLKYRGW